MNAIPVICEDIIHLLKYDIKNLEDEPLAHEYFERDVKLMKELQKNVDNIEYVKNFHDIMRNFSQSFGSYSPKSSLIDKKIGDLYRAIEDYIIMTRTNKL